MGHFPREADIFPQAFRGSHIQPEDCFINCCQILNHKDIFRKYNSNQSYLINRLNVCLKF